MASALRGPESCARCAAPLDAAEARCPSCGVRIEPVAAGSALAVRSGPLTDARVATARRRRSAVALDLVLLLAVAGIAATATDLLFRPLLHDGLLAALVGAAVLLVALAVLVALVAVAGRSPGRAALGLVTVDAITGLPCRSASVALGAAVAGRGRTMLTTAVRGARDPRSARPAPVAVLTDADLPVAAPVRLAAAPVPLDAGGARLLFDTGDELLVDRPVLIGRDPEPRAGVTALHALPDLSRGVARTHLRADWADGLLWVTDLGSPGGSVLRTDAGGIAPLVPDVRTAVAPGWQVRLGGRSFTVRSIGAEERRGAEAARG